MITWFQWLTSTLVHIFGLYLLFMYERHFIFNHFIIKLDGDIFFRVCTHIHLRRNECIFLCYGGIQMVLNRSVFDDPVILFQPPTIWTPRLEIIPYGFVS